MKRVAGSYRGLWVATDKEQGMLAKRNDRNFLFRHGYRELRNCLRDRAPGTVQDLDAVTKDDGLARDRDFGPESIR